jgi:two-component system, cell cycle sensor histidine kinase and response regulator CckA
MGGKAHPTVLVVEDDEGIAELERGRLEDAGYRVAVAGTAEAAFAALSTRPVDLVLLDYRLPGGRDGLDFYARLKAAGLDPPVILVTGFIDEATVIRALRAGVRDFVTKSAEYLDYLPEAVGRVLAQVGTERQLAESEARLAGVITSAQDAILVAEADFSISLFNPAAERMFRCPAAEAVGRSLDRFIPPTLPAGAAGPGSPSLVGTRDRGVRADGEEFPLEASVARTEAGGKRFYTIVARDVTDRKQMEEALRRSEERHRSFVETTNEWVWVCDLSGRMRYNNPALADILGYGPGELDGANTLDLLHPDDRPLAEKLLARGAADRRGWSGVVFRFRHRDGTYRHLESNAVPTVDPGGRVTGFQGADRDITERRRLEDQLRQAQKMEAIGRLAGGVAHDFNNLLTVINGFSEMLLGDPGLSPNGRELVAEIARAGDQAAALTRQLLAFSRKQVLAPKVLDLNALVREMERMLARLIGADVQLASSLDPDLGRVRADPGQLEQVLLNLAVNARDAMPRGGRLAIETRNGGGPAGNVVVLEVADTGTGMDAETRARIFEPFFTTKEPGKGTGLGLAVVHGIVTQSGGQIEVESAPGRGTRFRIELPRVAGDPSTSTVGPVDLPAGTETLLLVEDEPAVRALDRRVLSNCGYTVLEAKDGRDALRVAAEHAGRIDVLVSDVVMPHLGGRQLAERLMAARPGIKVLFVSGYTDDAVVRHGVGAEFAFLPKPFSPARLARKVREVLDRA